jgi:spore germination protein GerM
MSVFWDRQMPSPLKSSSIRPARSAQPIDEGRDTMGLVATAILNPSSLFNAYNLALFGLVIGIILTLVSTLVIVHLSNVKQKQANKAVAEANERSNRAKAEATEANERVAMMLQQLRKAVEMKSPKPSSQAAASDDDQRHVSSEVHDKIVSAMKGYALTLTVLTVNNDKEAAQFGTELTKALRDAGLTVNASTSLFATPFDGLGMSTTSSDAGMRLYTALHAVGYELQDLPKRDPIMIYVGHKPHAQH